MDAEAKKEIDAIIEKSLPKQLSETLQKRLKELEGKERRLVTVEQSLQTSQSQAADLQGQVNELNKRVATEKSLKQREDALEKKERDQKVFELNAALNAERAGHNKVENFVNALMRNTEFRRDLHVNRISEYDANGNQRSVPQGENEMTTAE